MAKSALKNLILATAENTGLLNLLQKANPGNHQSVYVLAYHRVAEFTCRHWLSPDLISATPQQFEEQMKFVADRYHPISIQDVMNAAQGRKPLPKDAVLVTVDDGYLDFAEEIFPVCIRYGIRPLLFMPTAFVGTGTFWWDKVYQIIHLSGLNEIDTPIGHFSISTQSEKSALQKRLTNALKHLPAEKATEWIETTHSAFVQLTAEQQHNTLSWEELRQLVSEGAAVACHTHTHPILTRVSLEDARREIRTSQELLRQELGATLPIFAFPDGKAHAYNPALFEMLFSEGLEILFLLMDGQAMIQPGKNRMVLPRLSVWQSQTLPQFHMRMTPIVGVARFENAKS